MKLKLLWGKDDQAACAFLRVKVGKGIWHEGWGWVAYKHPRERVLAGSPSTDRPRFPLETKRDAQLAAERWLLKQAEGMLMALGDGGKL